MAAFIQMGHNTENLVGCSGLEKYAGVILSPVNRYQQELATNVNRFKQAGSIEVILDPQMYAPRAKRGKLPSYSYFPSDLDSADLSSQSWWQERINGIAECALELNVDSVCSPIVLPAPNKWSDSYYVRSKDNYYTLKSKIDIFGLRSLMTIIVNWDQMEDSSEAMRIASILTQNEIPENIYLVIDAEITPRVELRDERRLLTIMTLISTLEKVGVRVMVAHCSSDMIMFKAAGATDCSTGNHFNLRRFTRSRFGNDDDSGGRQIPYWFEQGMLAFLRESDIRRILNEADIRNIVGSSHSGNQFSTDILSKFSESLIDNKRAPWQALSWRQYLSWFVNAENDLSGVDQLTKVKSWLSNADYNWGLVEDNDVFLEERRNDGTWIRSWLQALVSFTRQR